MTRDQTSGRSKPCPVCRAPAAAEFQPFCSKRCREVDLGRWLGGDYRIPGPPADEEDIAAAIRERGRTGEGEADLEADNDP